jgi:Obg family GTPase CgtA-like protein
MSEKEGGLKIYDAHKDAKVNAFEILHLKAHYWKIQGEKVEKEYALINLSTDEGIQKLINYLDKIGVEDKLKEARCSDGRHRRHRRLRIRLQRLIPFALLAASFIMDA